MAAYTVEPGGVLVRVWCRHCCAFHTHGRADGPRAAHCPTRCSPYWMTGYSLLEVGPMTSEIRAKHHDELREGTLRRLRTGRRCTCDLEPKTPEPTDELEPTDAVDDRSSSRPDPESDASATGNALSSGSCSFDRNAEAAGTGAGTARQRSSQRELPMRWVDVPVFEREDASATSRDAKGGGPGCLETGTGAPLPPATYSRKNLHAQGSQEKSKSGFCAKCRRWLPAAAFRANPRVSTGLHSYCRECSSAEAKRWREQHADAVEARNASRRTGPVELVCAECGASFVGRSNRRTCSIECKRQRHARLERQRTKR